MGNAVSKMKTEPVCWVTGPALSRHEMLAVQRQRAAAGEIEIVGPISAVPSRPDLVRQPYVMRRTRAGWLRRKRAALTIGGAVGVYAITFVALAWEARWVLLSMAGLALAAYCLAWLVSRFTGHTGACVGLHCPGCPDA